MTHVKAKLSVVLKANEITVVEVEDAELWSSVLTAINTGNALKAPRASTPPEVNETSGISSTIVGKPIDAPVETAPSGNSPIERFARDLGLAVALVQGAVDPESTGPYLHLDPHHWESMRNQLPKRGPSAVGPIVAAATLLCLWSKYNGMASVTQAQAQAVLLTIGLRDTNAARNLQAPSWLQTRPGGQILVNPSQISKAVNLARSFCTQDWSAWKG